MALQLFEHNAKAYHAAAEMLTQYGKAAIIHPTGTGKSYIAFQLIADHPDAVILWLSPSEYIFKTQVESVQRRAPDLSLQNVHFYTYAKLLCCAQEQLNAIAARHPQYIILDEFHRVGAECWGQGVQRLLQCCPRAALLGVTATNVRYLDNNRDMAEELFDGHIASEMTLGEAIVRGILPAPKYVTTVYQYQKELEKLQARVDAVRTPGAQDLNQKYLDELRRALEQADGLDKVFARHMENRSGKYIVFCANQEHMRSMIAQVPEWFSGVNPKIKIYRTCSEDPAASKEFAAFKQDKTDALHLLFCIDMLNEGVHVADIAGVILFRPTVSPIVYKQQIGRALTAGDTTVPLILDVVNNFDALFSISGLQNEMTAAVHRLYANGESEKVVTERFEVVEQVQDCRILFERLEKALSSTWDYYFSQASMYYAEHDSLQIPVQYTTPTGLSLGSWLQIQRLVRKGKRSGKLTQQQIERLDSIGMQWDDRADLAWNRAYASAQKYYREHGDLLIPSRYKDETGFALGQWITIRRQKYLDGELMTTQIQQLEAIGMVWDTVSARWEQGYAAAAAYYADKGNLKVPAKYKTPSGIALGTWLASQRQAYQKGTLRPEQVQRLEAIGMIWGKTNEESWQRNYSAAKQYFAEHHNLQVPTSYVTPDGIQLGKWLAAMRYAAEKPETTRTKLTAERKALLDEIGMCWQKPDAWQYRLELVKKYRQEHGSLKIPMNYKTAEGIWLGRWWYEQKAQLKKEPVKLSQERRYAINELLRLEQNGSEARNNANLRLSSNARRKYHDVPERKQQGKAASQGTSP